MIAVPLSFAYRFFQRAPETSTADQRPAITIKAAQGYVHELVAIIDSDFDYAGIDSRHPRSHRVRNHRLQRGGRSAPWHACTA
jgi:hypothetical protein